MMPPDNYSCLNCQSPLQGEFCAHCGQSAKTHRFTLKHGFKHDFLHGIFHFDKGLFYSMIALFTRPGHSIREYNAGKRVNHLNYFSLLVILILVFTIVENLTPFHYSDLGVDEYGRRLLQEVDGILKKYPKLVFMGVIPFYALISFWMFGKAKQNYAEHFVLNCYKQSALLFMNILFLISASFIKDISTIGRIDSILAWMATGYGTWFYYQYFSPFYEGKMLLLIKSLVSAVSLVVLALVAGLMAYAIVGMPITY